MVTPFWRLVANNRLLNRLVVDVLLRTLKPTHTVIIVRARYAEDRLWQAVSAGIQQLRNPRRRAIRSCCAAAVGGIGCASTRSTIRHRRR